MLTRDDVAMAYRLLLGREPEGPAVLDQHRQRFQDLRSLREAFMDSEEFRSTVAGGPHFMPTDLGPPLSVDLGLPEAELQSMFQRIEGSWQALGKSEPYWSVASCEQFRFSNFSSHEEEFDATGKRDADRLFAWLDRNGIDPTTLHTCSEYGCGVGRVTTWLAPHFSLVYGYDISAPHLQLAEAHLQNRGIHNVTLLKLDAIASLDTLKPADLLFSLIVLQHNPPPVMHHLLRMLLRSLNIGGVGYFQVPTYAAGYRFAASDYFDSSPGGSFEMHVLPQSRVFELVQQEGCRVLEVQPDPYVGRSDWISNTFLVKKTNSR